MKNPNAKRGFTLVEMLVVIAIIAVLVAVIIPTTSSAANKAKAATDAANLRSLLAEADVLLLSNSDDDVLDQLTGSAPESKLHPGADVYVVNNFPAFVDVYFVDGTAYYGIDYLSDVATNGKSDLATAQPTGDGYESDKWVNLSAGAEE